MLSAQNRARVAAGVHARRERSQAKGRAGLEGRPYTCLVFLAALFLIGNLFAQSSGGENRDWPVYGGAPENQHYSALNQINKFNVKRLEVAWTFDTEETGTLQTSPIVIDGTLYGISPIQKIFALDAATGKLKWKFDSGIAGTQPDRGLAYWSSADNKDRRIIVGVMNFVYVLDASTG